MTKANSVLEVHLGISSRGREPEVLRLLIELGAQFVGAEEGSLLVYDEAKKALVFAMTTGSKSSEKALLGQAVPVGKGITGLAAQTREVQIGAPVFKTRQARPNKGPQAVLAAPMLIEDHLVGVLTAVSFRSGKEFTGEDAVLYGRIAAVAGVVVDQARRLSELQALRRGGRSQSRAGADERTEFEIANSVLELTRNKPHAKARIARLLVEIAALAAE